MTLLVEECQTGSLGLKAGVGLALPCRVRMAWLQAGGSDLERGTRVAGKSWSHFGEHLLHCSLKVSERQIEDTLTQAVGAYTLMFEKQCMYHYQKKVSFVLAVGDVFHVKGDDVFCVAS